MSRINITDHNVHDLQFREPKNPQGHPARPTADLFRLDGRTIIITGACGALGTTLAASLLESGADVICLDLPPEPPKTAAWESVQATASTHSTNLTYYSLDTTDETAVTDTFARFVPHLRYPLRGLVACAGISQNGPATEFPTSAFRRVLDVNVTGSFLTARATAREMQRADVSGSIVLVASMSGYGANKGVDTAAYNSSKAAVHQLTRSLASEWGSRVGMPLVRVNSLSPGYIRTAATAEALQKPGMEAQWTGDNMLLRLSTPDEFRAPVVFLLGDGSSFMTGQDLRVDGGHTAW